MPVGAENDSVWLNRNQMAELFERDVKLMKDRIRENEIDYVLVGDYCIPELYNDLILSCQIWTYFANVNEQAQRIGFHLAVKSGSFYVLIIETSENGKNILYNVEGCWIYCR